MNANYTRLTARWLLPVASIIAVALGSFIFLASGADDGSAVGGLPLKWVADVALGGRPTRLDYASYDPDRHLLFIAHLGDSEVVVFDTRATRVVARIRTWPLSTAYSRFPSCRACMRQRWRGWQHPI